MIVVWKATRVVEGRERGRGDRREKESVPVGATKNPGEGGMKTGAKLAILWLLLLLFLFPPSPPIAPKLA